MSFLLRLPIVVMVVAVISAEGQEARRPAYLDVGQHKQQSQRLTTILENQGYTVQRGAYEYLTPERCQELKKCYCNNPISPYGITFLPKGPNEDISTYSTWGDFMRTEVNGIDMSANYRLDANETIIMLGQTPPRSLYYSYTPYVFDRWFPSNWSSPQQIGRCPDAAGPNGSRCDIHASFGDPINMMKMNTSGERGQSFNSEFALFMGGDTTQITEIKRMSVQAGIIQKVQNTYALSTKRLHLGLTPESDGISHWVRITFPDNKDEIHEYVYNAPKYVTILRVTPGRGQPGPTFLPYKFSQRISDLEAPPDGISHAELQVALGKDLTQGIRKKYLQDYNYVDPILLESPFFNNGYYCMDKGTTCNADNQDTLYPNSRKHIVSSETCTIKFGNKCPIPERATLQEDGSDFFIVTGVNHNATRSAMYSSIAMYNWDKYESLGSFSSMPMDLDEHSYVGSANQYIGNHSLAKYLFAVKVTRKCGENEAFCLEIRKSGTTSLPLDTMCLFIERIYLTKMKTGPSKDATIKPLVFHFSSKRNDERNHAHGYHPDKCDRINKLLLLGVLLLLHLSMYR